MMLNQNPSRDSALCSCYPPSGKKMAEKSDPAADLQNHSHCRFNPLLDEWVLVSPHRCNRPWTGEVSKPQSFDFPDYDPKNPLCPGNTRSNGKKNDNYTSTFIFDNDFPALQETDVFEPTFVNEMDIKDNDSENIFYRTKPATGKCRVMCFHPKSNLTIPLMTNEDLIKVIEKWAEETKELTKKYCHVQVFENKGAMMGCSNPHPHCQIWSTNYYPNILQKKIKSFTSYFKAHKSSLVYDYAKSEISNNSPRIVDKNQNWVILVPFWALWPYETLLVFIGREKVEHFFELTDEEKADLASIMKKITTRYDNLFKCSFPYSMGFAIGPNVEDKENLGWQLHGHYFPPLLRSATVKKHMVGYELMAQAQRDLTSEMAAKKLKEVDADRHYTLDL